MCWNANKFQVFYKKLFFFKQSKLHFQIRVLRNGATYFHIKPLSRFWIICLGQISLIRKKNSVGALWNISFLIFFFFKYLTKWIFERCCFSSSKVINKLKNSCYENKSHVTKSYLCQQQYCKNNNWASLGHCEKFLERSSLSFGSVKRIFSDFMSALWQLIRNCWLLRVQSTRWTAVFIPFSAEGDCLKVKKELCWKSVDY